MSALKTGCDLLRIEWGPGIILFECRSHRVTGKAKKTSEQTGFWIKPPASLCWVYFSQVLLVYLSRWCYFCFALCVCVWHHCSNMIDAQLFLVVLSTSPGLRWFLASHP